MPPVARCGGALGAREGWGEGAQISSIFDALYVCARVRGAVVSINAQGVCGPGCVLPVRVQLAVPRVWLGELSGASCVSRRGATVMLSLCGGPSGARGVRVVSRGVPRTEKVVCC